MSSPDVTHPVVGFTAKGFDASDIDSAEEIIARDIRFGIGDNPVRHWNDGELLKTAVLDGFSIMLPEGERFFIRSLKHYAPLLSDKKLAEEIQGYSIQEAYHTREHEDYNRALRSLGYDVDGMEKPLAAALRSIKKPLSCLTITCAIEHITAIFSTVTLRHPEILAHGARHYRRMWYWHALEELEHKGVAMDVFAEATRDMSGIRRYFLRVGGMIGFLIPFTYFAIANLRTFGKNEGETIGFGFWWRAFKALFVAPGVMRRAFPHLLAYFVPGFHPNKTDDRELIRKGRKMLYDELVAAQSAAE